MQIFFYFALETGINRFTVMHQKSALLRHQLFKLFRFSVNNAQH